MKIYSQLLALCLLPGATAFMVQAPKAATSKTALASSFGDPGRSYGTDTRNTNIGVGQGSRPGSMATTSGVGTSGTAPLTSTSVQSPDRQFSKDMWDNLNPTIVQGSSLRTWSVQDPNVEAVQVLMRTDGRPLNANVELWQGPDNTPQKMRVYIEDGSERSFNAVVETPRDQNAIAIYNTGQLEFPLSAAVEPDVDRRLDAIVRRLSDTRKGVTVQGGGSVKTYPFAPNVASVQVSLKTDGRPLNARIELLQGPNNNKQVMEIYTEDGMERPFFVIIDTPGTGNVVRLINTGPVEFPISAIVEPYLVEPTVGRGVSLRGGQGSNLEQGWWSGRR